MGMNTEEDFYKSITRMLPLFEFLLHLIFPLGPGQRNSIPPELASEILKLYPNDPSTHIGASLGRNFVFGPPYGAQYRRAATFYGDMAFIAGRRLTCQTWAGAGVPAFCYRFNAIPAGVMPIPAVTHFQEIGFVFYNTIGVGYPPVAINPFFNKSEAYKTLARFMDSNWISFIYDLDPNSWRSKWNGTEALWPKYDVATPMDYVFDANVTSYAEHDTYRAEGMRLIGRYLTRE
jgi:Carboxylesterase family